LPAAKLPALQPLVFPSPVITTQQDVDAWNGPTYPRSAPADVQQAAMECDFYKYRGRGLNQLTFWTNYKRYAGPSIQRVFNKTVDAMKSSELDDAMMNPDVYLDTFRLFNLGTGASISQLVAGSFAAYGTAVAGDSSYGSGIYTTRCVALRAAMVVGGVIASD
jgi:predicted chitinase